MKRTLGLALFLAALCSCSGKISDDNYFEQPATDTWMLSGVADIDNYRGCMPCHSYELLMAKGEYEHVQIVIRTADDGPLKIERKGDAEDFDISFRTYGSFDGMNDILVPCQGSVTPKSKLAKIWLTVHSPRNAKAGKYEEIVSFSGTDTTYRIRLSIQLGEVSIPQTPSIPCVFGVNPQNFVFTGLDEAGRTAKKREAADLLLDYRISPYFCTWLAGTMNVECSSSPYAYGTSDFWDYLKDERFAAIALPSHNLSDNQLKSMLEGARTLGLLDKAYFYIWDEPTTMNQYAGIRSMADRIHGYAPEAKVLTTYYCGPQDGPYKDDLFAMFDILDGATSLFCTGVWSLQGNEGRSANCRAKLKEGQEWWTYVCMSDYPGLAFNSNGIANRAVLWRSWKEQSAGFLYWVVNAFSAMDPLSKRPELPQGDGLLLYPGEAFGVDGFCVSARLERWRDGEEDYELLSKYAQANGRDAAENVLAGVYQSPTSFTNTIADLDAFRKALITGGNP